MAVIAPGDSIRVLIVEDDPQDAMLMRAALAGATSLHFTTSHVESLSSAVATLADRDFDVVLLDLNLPDSSGMDTVSRMAGSSLIAPIVVVTDHRDLETGLNATRLGAQGFVSKSDISDTNLPREIAHAMERRGMLAELETHRERLEEMVQSRTKELTDAIARLKAHDRAQTEFIYNVSHELRTPLTSMIFTLTNLLHGAHGKLSGEINQSLTMLQDDCGRLKNTVEDILDLSRMDEHRFALKQVPVALHRLVSAFSNEAAEWAGKHHTGFHCTIDTEAAFVLGDPDQLKRCLFNLLKNAVRFSPEGGRVALTLAPCKDNPSDIVLTVSDTGPGIAPEHLPHITDRYYRVGEHIEGTGLGLPITQELVALHGGRLSFVSPPPDCEHGTRACITLPTTPAPFALTYASTTEPREALIKGIESMGWRAGAWDGQAGLETILASAPSAVVLDMVEPDQRGIILISKLKSNPHTKHIPIVAVTGSSTDAATGEILTGLEIPRITAPWSTEAIWEAVEPQLYRDAGHGRTETACA